MNVTSLEYLKEYTLVKNEKIYDKNDVALALTIYKTPPRTPIDVSFWKTDAILGEAMCIKTMDTQDQIFPTQFLPKQLIMSVLGLDSLGDPRDVSGISIFSQRTFEASHTLPSDLYQAIGGAKRVEHFGAAIIESTIDYARGSGSSLLSGDNIVRFIIALHPYGNVDYVYMTMRVDYDPSTKTAEHRHIQTSFKAFVAPYVDPKRRPVIPGRLSMLMHVATARILRENTYAYSALKIQPLESMLRVLKKTGFVSQDVPDKGTPVLTLTGKTLARLYLYLPSARRDVISVATTVNACIVCQSVDVRYQCTTCNQPLTCAQCVHMDVHECC